MATGMDCGCMCSVMMTLCSMAAILKKLIDQGMQPWFTVNIFDFRHPCYGQLTPVKTRYSLTSSRDHITGSGLEFMFFKVDAPAELFLWRKRSYTYKGKMSARINAWRVVDSSNILREIVTSK